MFFMICCQLLSEEERDTFFAGDVPAEWVIDEEVIDQEGVDLPPLDVV